MTESEFVAAFDRLASAGAEAEREKNNVGVRQLSIQLGMVETPADRQIDNYVLRHAPWELIYSWRFYDTSQAFSPGLDRNFLNVTLLQSGVIIRLAHFEWLD